MDGMDRKQRNAAQRARVAAARALILKEMKERGWNPAKVRGYSNKYRVALEKERSVTVAIKVDTLQPGWIGFAQKRDGEWGSPLSDTDFIVFATPYTTKRERGLGVWMFETKAVRDRLELVQKFYDEADRSERAALWFNIFDVSNRPTCQVNFAAGKPPLWVLPFEVPAPEDFDEAVEADVTLEPTEPESSPLAAFTTGQLLDELVSRGLKGFRFGSDA